MEETICNQVPLNTEKKDINTIGKKNNILYCPDNIPFICGSNTKRGKEMVDNKNIYCISNPGYCNNDEDIENKRPFFYKEDGFITEKINCDEKNLYNIFNQSPPKTPIKYDKEKQLDEYVENMNIQQLREEIKKITGKYSFGTASSLKIKLKELYKKQNQSQNNEQKIPYTEQVKPISQGQNNEQKIPYAQPVKLTIQDKQQLCKDYIHKINDKESLVDYYKKKMKEIEDYYKEQNKGNREREKQYIEKIKYLEKNIEDCKKNIDNNYYKVRLEGKEEELNWYKRKFDEGKIKFQEEKEKLLKQTQNVYSRNQENTKYNTDVSQGNRIIKKNKKGNIYIDVPTFIKVYGKRIEGPQEGDMKGNEYYTFQNTDYIIKNNEKGIPEIIAEKSHGGKFHHFKIKSKKKNTKNKKTKNKIKFTKKH